MPSDMMQDIMPNQVTPGYGQRCSRHMAVLERNHHGTQCPVRWRTKSPTRVRQQTYVARGVCEPALKPPLCREDCLGKCHGRQPDSGNLTVRDETGGLGKREVWESD